MPLKLVGYGYHNIDLVVEVSGPGQIVKDGTYAEPESQNFC